LFYLEKEYADEMVRQAVAEAPDECCGILAGAGGKVVKLYRATNAEHSPFRYSVDPEELIRVYQEIEERGWELLGIYHSHTFTGAYTSAIDIKYAFWSQSLYFIISLNNPAQPVIKAFRIIKGSVVEEELEITEKAPNYLPSWKKGD
jgi:[CysO sulfur-carrier protein]-S-L-cysteine hydrolase